MKHKGGNVLSDDPRRGGAKIIFANQLRGLAALMVVASHLIGVFILMGPDVNWVTSSPHYHIGHPLIVGLISWRWLNFGPLGVGIFFLISGFVIPLSLESHPPGRFLVARFFRIFPTLWTALFLEWLTVSAQSRFYGIDMAFGPLAYLSNAALLDTVFDKNFVDMVNWTLCIEIKFYVLMALLRPWILRGRVTPLVVFSALAFALAAAQKHGVIHISSVLADEPMYIGFMFIGTVFYYRIAGLISSVKALGTGAMLTGLFALGWRAGPLGALFPVVTVNYLYAVAIFGAAYFARRHFRAIGFLDFLADISYPLYLIHAIIGFSLMEFIINILHLPYAVALPCGFTGVVLLAWLLHNLAERPSNKFGKRLARDIPWKFPFFTPHAASPRSLGPDKA